MTELQKLNNKEPILDNYRIKLKLVMITTVLVFLEIAEPLIFEAAEKQNNIFEINFWCMMLLLLVIKFAKKQLSIYSLYLSIITFLNLIMENGPAMQILINFWDIFK